MTVPSDRDYAALLAFRTELRRFQQWSEHRAQEAGLTHAQHQLLLAVRGHLDPRGPTIGEVAAYLLLTPSATVELVDRVEQGGFLRRVRDEADRRVVRLRLTPLGDRRLAALTALVVPEVRDLAPVVARLIRDLSPRAAHVISWPFGGSRHRARPGRTAAPRPREPLRRPRRSRRQPGP